MRTRLTVALLACLLSTTILALGAGSAGAAGLPAADVDCNDNATLTQHYTIAQLQTALSQMPAQMREYSDCYVVIQRQLMAQLGQLGKPSGSAGSGGSFLPAWLIVVLALLVAGGAGFGVLALRNRRGAEREPPLN